MSEACPCGQGEYHSCCQPLHTGQQVAETAQQLLRVRYSAFAKHEIDYIKSTSALGLERALDLQAISDWSKFNQWLKREIVQNNEKLDKNQALIECKAHFHDGKQAQV